MRILTGQATDARLEFNGLEEVPACYRRNVYHMLQQLVRNAIEHGIETPAERKAAGKATAGRITVDCSDRGEAGIEIIVRDDGRGFDTGLIGRVAVEKGLLTPEALARTDPRTLIGLIFRPGFSTEGIAGCAGKGLGMVFFLARARDAHGRTGQRIDQRGPLHALSRAAARRERPPDAAVSAARCVMASRNGVA